MIQNWLQLVFDTFSKRRVGQDYPLDHVPETLRNTILFLCCDVFSGQWRDGGSAGDYRNDFWREIHHRLQYLYGRPHLSRSAQVNTTEEDVLSFLLTCEAYEFLDFIEQIFRVDSLWRVIWDENRVVEAINELFRSENAPYQLTPILKQEEENTGDAFPFRGGTVIRTVAYPKVIRAEDEVTFSQAIAPALSVLADPAYRSANLEFRDALEEYRKGDYGDCLTKCGSAFESVMKVLCQKNGWPFDAQATAAPLLKTVLQHTSLENFFEQPLILIATLRNRLSKAHGAGAGVRAVQRHIAQYAITSTAAAILLLVHEAG